MSDLVERLRKAEGMCRKDEAVISEAADEIERLHDSCAELRDVITKKCQRIEELEAIVRVYADPTGGSQEDQDTIMSCHDWWKEEQAALKGVDDE